MERTHEQWVEQISNLLLRRNGRPVVMLVHNDHGLEIITNTSDITLVLGVIHAADIMTEERFKAEIAAAEKRGISAAMQEQVSSDLQGKKVWGN